MRLLLVTQDFPPDIGGTQTYAYELARRFAVWCEDFAVIAPYVEGCTKSDQLLPFDVYRIKSSYDGVAIKALPAILKLAHERKFEATFHIQWPHAIAGFIARKYSSIKHVFAAAHGRELLLNPMPTAWLNAGYNKLRKAVVKQLDGLFPVSNYTKEILISMGAVPSRVFVSPNGVDVTRFYPRDATSLKLKLGISDQPVLLTVSRLVPRKGIDTVIQALPALVKKIPKILYLIGGTGPDQARLEHLVTKAQLHKHVRFLGRISDIDLPLFYNLCDVFTMPAHHAPPDVEGFGLVFLEAGACRKPIIGTAVGGIPDAIEDGVTGVLIPPDAPDTLANQITTLLSNKEKAHTLGAQAIAYINNNATWGHRAFHILASIQLDKQIELKLMPALVYTEEAGPFINIT